MQMSTTTTIPRYPYSPSKTEMLWPLRIFGHENEDDYTDDKHCSIMIGLFHEKDG